MALEEFVEYDLGSMALEEFVKYDLGSYGFERVCECGTSANLNV